MYRIQGLASLSSPEKEFGTGSSVGSKIQKFKKFNSAKTGIGFQKYSVAFCVSVFSRRQNIRAFVA